MASGKGARLTMKLDEAEVRKYLAEMARKGKDVRPYFKRLGAYMAYRSVDKTFEEQGRAKFNWASKTPLADYTIAMRQWRADKFGRPAFTRKILEVGGDLRGSFTFIARSKRLDVGTAYPNAEKHQKGGTARAPARWKRSTVKIPARPFLHIWPKDEKRAVKAAIRYLDKG